MQSLVWAVNEGIKAGDQELIRDYFKGYVKSYNVTSVALVDNSGKFIITTDQKLEGEKYEGPYTHIFAETHEIICEFDSDRGEYLVASPIYGEVGMMGYLFYLFRPDNIGF